MSEPSSGEATFRLSPGKETSSSTALSSLKCPWLQRQDTAYCWGPSAIRHISSLAVFKHTTASSKSGGLPTYSSQCICRKALQGWGFARCDGVVGQLGAPDQTRPLGAECHSVHGRRPSSGTQPSRTSRVSPLLPIPPKPEGAEGRPGQTASPEAFVPIPSAHPLGAGGGRGLLYWFLLHRRERKASCCCIAGML